MMARWKWTAIALCAFTASAFAQQEPPKLNALGVVVMDADSGRILYGKNANLRLHPASTTKIMTALLLAEKCTPDETIVAPDDVKTVKESSMHLEPGEALSASEMMYGLLLRSANDGCHSVAIHIAGSEAAFADLMNKRAKEIGCTKTSFVNPHGLTDPNHLTTPHDLALIAREAMKNPEFAKVAGTQKHVLVRSLNLKDTFVENHDKWLALDSRAKGVKTGWTKPAGHCFVGCATDKGVTFITVIMKSDAWIHDQQAITDWAFSNFEPRQLCFKGEQAGAMKVKNGQVPSVPIVYGEERSLLLANGTKPPFVWDQDAEIPAPVTAGTVVGYATVEDIRVPLVAAESVKERTVLSTLSAPGGIVGFIALAGGAFLFKSRSRRMVREMGRL